MDLEDLWAVEPSLRSGFYIQPISLLNHIETSKTVSNLYLKKKKSTTIIYQKYHCDIIFPFIQLTSIVELLFSLLLHSLD